MKQEIKKFITNLEKDYKIFRYLHSKPEGKFDPSKDTVFYAGPYWDEHEKIALIESILIGDWLSSGKYVKKFEDEFSKKFNFKYSVMVNSGSSANLIMINALKIYNKWEDGDEIILSPSGFPTTLTPLIQNNLTPVFVDINWEDLNFDVNKIEEKITDKTKAIFISPVLGNPPDMDTLIRISLKYDIELILDNCDSLGSKLEDRYLSEYCISSSCSFYPSHHITTGEGGMVSTNRTQLYKIIKSLSSWGRACTCVGADNLLPDGICGKRFGKWLNGYEGIVDHKYIFSQIGYNVKPMDFQGAIGIEQLKKFENIFWNRVFNKWFLERFEQIKGVRVLKERENATTSWFGVGVVCDTKELKDKLVAFLEENRIQTRNYFGGNLLMHPAFKDYGNAYDYPIASQVIEKVFFVGCSPVVTFEMLKYIENVINKFKEL